MTLTESKAALLSVRAEYDQRLADMRRAADRSFELDERISRYVGESILDNVDHGARIIACQEEQAACAAIVNEWPDVELVLQDRIAAAETAYREALEADRAKTLAELDAKEGELRREFADAALKRLEVSYAIADLHEKRTKMRVQVVDEYTSGERLTLVQAPNNPQKPPFEIGWLFHRQHQQAAARALRDG